MEVATFTCSICGEGSQEICVYCTKDACSNHLCERCRRCSDCCQCEVALVEEPVTRAATNGHVRILDEPAELDYADELDEEEEEKEFEPEVTGENTEPSEPRTRD